jgi:hypothetical protein
MNDVLMQTYPTVSTGTSGVQNKSNILAIYTHGSIEDTCAAMGLGWYLPSSNELSMYVSNLLLQFYWTSNDANTMSAYAVAPNGAVAQMLKSSSLAIVCNRYYALN